MNQTSSITSIARVICCGVMLIQAQHAGAQSSCPTTLTLVHSSGTKTYEVRALQEKIFTKSELENYYKQLQQSYAKARADGHANSYFAPDEDKHLAFAGCPISPSAVNLCTELLYSGGIDTFAPRIKLYECHKKAGWPSANDSGFKSKSYKVSG